MRCHARTSLAGASVVLLPSRSEMSLTSDCGPAAGAPPGAVAAPPADELLHQGRRAHVPQLVVVFRLQRQELEVEVPTEPDRPLESVGSPQVSPSSRLQGGNAW